MAARQRDAARLRAAAERGTFVRGPILMQALPLPPVSSHQRGLTGKKGLHATLLSLDEAGALPLPRQFRRRAAPDACAGGEKAARICSRELGRISAVVGVD
ncbi:hypothetical protein cyc_01217 [Cyclospora cayetanensis]|uniref:Uncharacterized protein n=1 Tax=Cyclospora cayetanensis TaxID=88456 RepID=A0A1D3D1T4_9EIME|nr:hypothetical protein cyc_01217 [Cyclospora cayetanensis]